MNPWAEITCEPTEAFPDGQYTCPMPSDTQEVEVRLSNGEIRTAVLDSDGGECWFTFVDEEGEALDNQEGHDDVQAWRYPVRTPDMLENGGE